VTTTLARRTREVRGIALWVIRATGLTLLAYGAYLILARLVFGLYLSPDVSLGLLRGVKVWQGIAEDHGWVRGWPMVAVGGALSLASRSLARWIVAVPDTGCPRCGHDATTARGICPECGLAGLEPTPGEPQVSNSASRG
jgi:hypothetical protein